MVEIKNNEQTWAFCAAAAIWTEVHNGLGQDLLEHVPKKFMEEVFLRGKIDLFNKKIQEAVVRIDDILDNYWLCRRYFCWPPEELVEDMERFSDTQYIPLSYVETMKKWEVWQPIMKRINAKT